METKDILNRLTYILIFVGSSILLELATFYFLDFGFMPKYILLDIAFLFVISGILFMLKSHKAKMIITITLLSLQVILNCINICYYKVLGDIFSFDLIKLGTETVKAFSFSFIDWYGVLTNVFILILGIIFFRIFTKKNKKSIIKIKNKKLSAFALVLCAFMFFSCTGLTSKVIAEENFVECSTEDSFYIAKSDSYLYDNFQFKQEAFKKFGTWGFYIKSISNLMFNDNSISKKEKEKLLNYIEENEILKNDSAILKDKNLIVIMLESFDKFAIDPICTPTLYDLQQNQAQNFTNFFARNKTNISENIGMIGNSSKVTDLSTLSKNKNFSPSNSLAYKFKDLGYTTNYFHSYDKYFYDRNTVNIKLGFENSYGIQDSNLGNKTTFGNAHLEEDYLKEVIEELAPTDRKFFSFYTTFGTHGPYNIYNKRYKEYYDFYEDNIAQIKTYFENELGYHIPTDKTNYNKLKYYKSSAMDTDKMIKYLLNYLEQHNLLDKTTIVLYADHNCYYDDLNLFVRYNTIDINPNDSDQYNLPFMIYDKTLGGKQNEMFCSTYDIYPTICDLFGLSYNKALTQGYNVYSNDINNTIFISNLTGIFTDKLFSYNINQVFDFSGENLSNEEIYKFQLNAIRFYEKQEKIDKIYANGLYNHS